MQHSSRIKTDVKLISKDNKYSSSSEDDDSTILAKLVKTKSSASVAEKKRFRKKAPETKGPDSDPDTDERMDNLELGIDKNIISVIHSSLANTGTSINRTKSDNGDQRQRKKRKASYDSGDGSRNKVPKIAPVDNDKFKEAKAYTEPEGDSDSCQDLEAKKKYLSALNILEKGEADAQKPKPHEIRTRSKTEEKRERLRVSKEPQVCNSHLN